MVVHLTNRVALVIQEIDNDLNPPKGLITYIPRLRIVLGDVYTTYAHETERESGDAEYVQVQYNFDTTGGTSGSPVFDQYGWVIAVHFASIEARVTDTDGDPVRIIGVGSLNFGMRVDALWDFIECCTSPAAMPLRDGGRPLHQRTYPFTEYQPFPENWNSETIAPDM